jgi:hypothetical protein
VYFLPRIGAKDSVLGQIMGAILLIDCAGIPISCEEWIEREVFIEDRVFAGIFDDA